MKKKKPIKLDLEKIEIDVLTNATLSSVQGGYATQPGLATCYAGCGGGTFSCTCFVQCGSPTDTCYTDPETCMFC
jgi:hypothetical protein